jgi:hypothetical protein
LDVGGNEIASAILKNSSGGFRITGRKKKLLAEKLLSIVNAKGIDRLIIFLEILKMLASRKEMHSSGNAGYSTQH